MLLGFVGMWGRVGENTGLMGYGLFHGLNTREQGNWVVSGLRLVFVYWCFVLFVISMFIVDFSLLSVDVGNWAEPR